MEENKVLSIDRVYDRALSAEEIQQLYEEALNGYPNLLRYRQIGKTGKTRRGE